ncbi:sulfurtransferase TusA [Reinekea sp.]|jgi:tRNA 2-thiouridine synthesizing protein A|uniref:sulfurtransferase TusA n=1 Tax=Reinekea sp. TaxID=1970455 RepID=UPI002A813FD8|nr:sulfurtransferase TusA [Reinekea sp.]
MTARHTDWELDTRGLRCPEPVMMLHRQLRKMQVGEVVELLASDPATLRDVPQFCEFLPHRLVATLNNDVDYRFWIEKGERP